MKFRGLFVGIDRYASPRINWLTCSRQDAIALHALFTDTLGGGAALLLDDQATRLAIEQQFEELAKCDEDDVVVVSFSGHGSETHELVTYDADVRDLPATCIPLDTLTEWFSRIPARRLVCILDCCFSGGMGAKALKVDLVSRDLPSTESLLEQLSGNGRLILTASLATEKAYENQRLGHGLLTYYLLQAMQGAEEVVQSGKVGVYRLLEYVTQRVIDEAAKLGKPQNPTLRGTLDGNLTWPIFQPGPLYQAAFPSRSRQAVTEDIHSLVSYGFPQELLHTWAGSIPKLNQLQLDAINGFGLLTGEHLVVSAPTSSGKTMIGELAALRGALNRKRSLFLFPLKALVNDKLKHFQNAYGNFGLRTIRATGESSTDDIVPLIRGHYDICLMTYEKFGALVLAMPHILDQVGTIVIDEVQMIADGSRGVNLEFILTLLRMKRRQGSEPQLIALSAVIGDTNGLERWLGARLLRRTERPIPLDEGVVRGDGSYRFINSEDGKETTIESYIQPLYGKGSSQDVIIPLVQRLVSEGKRVIVFRETRGEARGCALYLAKSLGLPPAQAVLDILPTGDPSVASNNLRLALAGGVAFHISDLDPEERLIIEEHFRAPATRLRVLAATTTLAMGINTPAEAVIVAGLEHPGGIPYSIAEYKNIIGRAGRLGHSQRGNSYLVTLSPREEYHSWSHYILGTPENLVSQFLAQDTDPRSLILRVLVAAQSSSGQGLSSEEIVGFLEESFGVFQQKQTASQWVWDRTELMQALNELNSHKLIEADKGNYHLTKLGRLVGEAGVEVESIIRLVEALEGIDSASINDPTLIVATQLTVELNQLTFPMNKKSKQKEPQTWMSELQRQRVPAKVIRSLERFSAQEIESTLRAKKAVACLLWVTGMPLAQMEETLTQFGGGFDGAAGPIRSLRSRTCDLLPTVVRVAEILHPTLDLTTRASRLLTRLEMGIPAVAIDIANYAGDRLTRADYLHLIKYNVANIDAIEQSSDEALLSYLDNNRLKLSVVREAVVRYREQQNESQPVIPILPEYEG